MIPALGEFALWIALPIAIWGCTLAFLGGKRSRGDLVLSAERSTYVVFFLLALASAGVITAFLQNRYEYWYVYNYSSRDLPTYFKVTGLWAGQNGSLLFWALNLGLFSSLAVWFNRSSNRDLMPYVNGVLLAFLSFFIAITVFVTSPFELNGFTPAEGRGLNPQLQSYWMTIHPPMLYLGFTAFTVPFAFAMAALISGKVDSRWIQVTRKWTLTSWLFLSLGIVLGMRWAYEELGWGGYWFWDPVENASLLPWLVATAFLHSVMIQENRGMLKIWNMGLVILTFLMTIFATFLTRSGLIASVHSFAQNETIAWIFLVCLGVVGAVASVLVVHRLPLLQSDRQFESFVSREAAFLMNNLVLLGIAFAVAWGTLFPLLTEWLSSKVALGAEFFNRVNVPIGIALLALMGIGPVIAWRRATPQNLKRNFLAPGTIGLGVGAALFFAGARHLYALLTFSLGAFVLSVIAIEFWKGTKARARIEEESLPTAFVHLVRRNRQRWGGYVVHVGMVFLFMGLAGNAFDAEVRQNVVPGETIRIQSPFGHEYALQYQGLSTHIDPGHLTRIIALFTVERDGTPLAPLAPERNIVALTGQPISEVRYHTTLLEDLYVILEAYDQNVVGVLQGRPELQEATIAVLVNPLVPWIWYGALIVLVGTLIGLWPGAGGVPVRKAVSARASAHDGASAPVA